MSEEQYSHTDMGGMFFMGGYPDMGAAFFVKAAFVPNRSFTNPAF